MDLADKSWLDIFEETRPESEVSGQPQSNLDSGDSGDSSAGSAGRMGGEGSPGFSGAVTGLEWDPCSRSLLWGDRRSVVQSVLRRDGRATSRALLRMAGNDTVSSLHFDRVSGTLFVASNKSSEEGQSYCDVFKMEIVSKSSTQKTENAETFNKRSKRSVISSPLAIGKKAAKSSADRDETHTIFENAPQYDWEVVKIVDSLPRCHIASMASDGSYLYTSDWAAQGIRRVPLGKQAPVRDPEGVETLSEVVPVTSAFGEHEGARGLVVDRAGGLKDFAETTACGLERRKRLELVAGDSEGSDATENVQSVESSTVVERKVHKSLAEDGFMNDINNEVTSKYADLSLEKTTPRISDIATEHSNSVTKMSNEVFISNTATPSSIELTSTSKSVVSKKSKIPSKRLPSSIYRMASGTGSNIKEVNSVESEEDSSETTTNYAENLKIMAQQIESDSHEESEYDERFPGMSRGQLGDVLIVLMVLSGVLLTAVVLLTVLLIRSVLHLAEP